MNHQNEMNFPSSSSSSSSYYNFYQSQFQNPNPNPNPQFPPSTTASAPPDPSFYYSNDYYPNETLHYPDSTYDPNSIPSSHHHPTAVSFGGATAYGYTAAESSSVPAVRFDDYGRPITSADAVNSDPGVYDYSGGSASSARVPVLQFDDYGRPIDSRNEQRTSIASLDGDDKVLKASALKVEEERSGVHKFRVVLLSEGGGLQGDMDVLCQIGLDGIQILDPATSRTLKVYSLDTVTKWEVLDSNIFAFWTKSPVDISARRVRLKSNSYTTTKILDMVAAASFQFKEMEGVTISEQQPPAEKKKGFPDWINLMKPTNEEKDHWVPDEASTKCTACSTNFGAFVRRHHCRNCGDIFCDKCTQGRIALTAEENAPQVRVCDQCMAEVTQRLSHVNEVAGRSSGFNRHEELAKKLQEEMEKKRKTTADLKSSVPNQQMKEVECPTCTVHLQVNVPASGSKTIECSVCQHPFLVSAN